MALNDYIYLFIYHVNTYSHHCGVGAHQRRGKRQEEKTSENNEEKRIRAEEETYHLNLGNWCSNRGSRAVWKTEKRTKERNREQVPIPAALDYLIASVLIVYTSMPRWCGKNSAFVGNFYDTCHSQWSPCHFYTRTNIHTHTHTHTHTPGNISVNCLLPFRSYNFTHHSSTYDRGAALLLPLTWETSVMNSRWPHKSSALRGGPSSLFSR